MIVEEVGQYYLAGEPIGALYFKHLANKTFNKYVCMHRQSLLACGEQVDDLIHNLFSGYAIAQYCKFREYFAKKKESFEEGTAAEEQIVVLTGTIKELCDANLKLAKSLATVNKGQKDTLKEKYSDAQADVKIPKLSDIKSDTPVYGWMVVPPPPNSSLTKQVKGLTYYWCKYHKAWVCHTKDQCHKNPSKKNKPKGKKRRTSQTKTTMQTKADRHLLVHLRLLWLML
eukprot:9282289-Ditylum_brightwellii.AAC.1